MLSLESISSPARKTLGKVAYSKIREEIITLNFKPGQMLSESEIGSVLGVSRTPIREAFLMLVQEGLLEILPQRGARVALISEKRYAENMFVRESLEISALKLVAKNWKSDDLRYKESEQKAVELIEKQQSAALKGDHIEFLQYDELFHSVFLELVENETLVTVVSQMKAHLNRVRYLEFNKPNHMENVVSEHQDIFNAITSNNEEKTEELLRRHFYKKEALPKVIKMFPDYFTD
ncbi:GntR family transcriptional regulator [Neobacillus cucumis]|uniref:GntR family transcriptional regulator n=1 Tax=Neobacillus cucumis TaxID=1740721 RepID=UPI0028532888|nr:GntR family transcriptional regulator [Neobacillus cucumis]MDR4949817.1 GntR family transcriptional regulator [Neobacillus cucumis]